MSLDALERSDLSRLPGGIFTRAFIRAYAREVGLDPDRAIQDFIAELPPEAATATAHQAAVEDSEKLESDRRAVATAIRLVLISVPLIAVVVYYGAHRQPPAPPTGEGASAGSPAPESEPAAAPDGTMASGLRMEISPRGSCWVSVTVDGAASFSALMNAGESRVVTAKEQILVSVGDAGVFAYTLNGRTGKPLGDPGEVVSTRITTSNVNEFAAP
jgi:cytoskeletal protein RodZ